MAQHQSDEAVWGGEEEVKMKTNRAIAEAFP